MTSLHVLYGQPVGWKPRVEVMSDVENPGSQKNTLKIYEGSVALFSHVFYSMTRHQKDQTTDLLIPDI